MKHDITTHALFNFALGTFELWGALIFINNSKVAINSLASENIWLCVQRGHTTVATCVVWCGGGAVAGAGGQRSCAGVGGQDAATRSA